MDFAGASLIADDKLCAATESVVDAGVDSGYHLLVVQGYSRTKEKTPKDEWIESHTFIVVGRRWIIDYHPNGFEDEEYISLVLTLDDDIEPSVNVQYVFSSVDQSELRVPKNIRQSQSVYLDEHLDGQYEFMKMKDVERSRHLKDGSFILRHLGNLLLSKECAHITFEVGGEDFAAHRCLLVARSSVFKAQLCGAMNESSVVKISPTRGARDPSSRPEGGQHQSTGVLQTAKHPMGRLQASLDRQEVLAEIPGCVGCNVRAPRPSCRTLRLDGLGDGDGVAREAL
ncbi:BTB/POZ and MATH domain-containing protein 2-like [Triticum aestivum]|uniref:BTB/POZ and MATH domain-containing protein 2-like n=1 Tax=Triticum aestivum TaxID=4565 RepID=UPI001D032E69|nr:BTB/POZ and MATH domain-containing protein 2-like [Triticum aestivum]